MVGKTTVHFSAFHSRKQRKLVNRIRGFIVSLVLSYTLQLTNVTYCMSRPCHMTMMLLNASITQQEWTSESTATLAEYAYKL